MKWRLLFLAVLFAPASPARGFDRISFVDPHIYAKRAGRIVAAAVSGDRVYVVDEKGSMLWIFDTDGKHVKTVKGELKSPSGVAIGPAGEVYVADTKNNRVVVFDPSGRKLRTIGGKGGSGGQLSKPAAVAVAADGRVYVADTGNHRIQVYTEEGIYLFGFGGKGRGPGRLDTPVRVEVTLSDHVYVLEEGNERIQRFKPDTTHDRYYNLAGVDFAVDGYGFLYVLDRKRGRVREIGLDGKVLGRFGTSGKGKRQFRKPQGLAIGPDGTIFVVDTGNKRLVRVRLENQLKRELLTHNLATKLLVSGPIRQIKLAASALDRAGGVLYAFDTAKGQIVAFSAEGKETVRFGGEGEAKTRASSGFAVSPKHGVYIADKKGHRIQVFSRKGVYQHDFGVAKGLFASKKKEGRVKAPHDVAVNEGGTVYIADTGNRRVDAFSPDGAFLFSFGPEIGEYELEEPVSLAWDPAGFIYVLDRKLRKVFKCRPSGGLVKVWGMLGDGVQDFDDPVAISYDGRSYLFILDRGAKRVMVYDREGNWITNFFAQGEDERNLYRPVAMTVIGSRLYISDPERERITAFKLHPRLAPPVKISTRSVEGRVQLTWKNIEDPWVKSFIVLRSTGPWGPFVKIGESKKPGFKDGEVQAGKRYWYRVAVEADTGDVGPASRPTVVFVPRALNLSPISLSTVTIGNIFSANYKWYLDNPLGSAVLVNNMNLPFRDVKVSFRLKDFMDFATEKTIPLLEANQTVSVPLVATLNNKILEVSEDTPIQAEVTLTYFERGSARAVSKALPLKVYSRNAITWEDPRRIANFITPKDPPVLDLGREIQRQAVEAPAGTEHLNGNLMIAMRLWSALGTLGVKFLPSPNNPFAEVSEDPAFPVDYTQFPRETLRRKSGECDDMVTLLASLFEGAAVRSAILDYPGHLALMFDTGTNDAVEVGISEDRLISYDGTLWVPLEATMVGLPFHEAVRKAHFAYQDMKEKGRVNIIDPRESWKDFKPATLPSSDQERLKPDAEKVAERFDPEAKRYLKERYAFLSAHWKGLLKKDGPSAELSNRMGILEVQHAKSAEAKKHFEKALALESGNAAAYNNLGSLAFVAGNFTEARGHYLKAAAADSGDAGIWMNLTRTALKLSDAARAKEYSKKAVKIDAALKLGVESLIKL